MSQFEIRCLFLPVQKGRFLPLGPLGILASFSSWMIRAVDVQFRVIDHFCGPRNNISALGVHYPFHCSLNIGV